MLSPCLPLSLENEPALLTRWRNGDRTAGLVLLRGQVSPLRRYFSRRVPCPADAEDLVQRTLLASIDALPGYRGDVALAGFVRAIASKLLLRYRRDYERARVRLDADVQPDAMQAGMPSALACVCHEDELERLQEAFRGIPEASAQLLHMRYWEERDTSEIARALELEPGAVRTRLHRARREMKRMLAALTEGEAEDTVVSIRRPRGAERRESASPRRTKNSGNTRDGREAKGGSNRC